MTTPKFDELVMLEQGYRAEAGLWFENLPAQLGRSYVEGKAREAQDRVSLAALDMDKRDARDAEADWPDIMWCHWCDAWRETGVDGGGTLHRRCVECGHQIRCDDCSQPVTGWGYCTTRGCPSSWDQKV